MRYFTYIAEQSFKTDAEGQRVFYLGSPLSRPYIIPDPATESRLFRKMTWIHRIFLSTLIVGQPFLLPRIIQQPLKFFVFLGAVMALQWLVTRIAFFSDLRKLSRAPARPSLRTFYGSMAQRHSVRALRLGLIGSLVFAAGGLGVTFAGGSLSVAGIAIVVLLGISAAAWGYALKLKLAQQSEQLS